jgi:ABC-type dipeptide/oligopeptide/nickel transport system permease component
LLRYIAYRILSAVPVLLIVLTIIFVLARVLPGDPARAALGDYASASAVEALRQSLGLNEPILVQYLRFLADLSQGNLGISMINGTPISGAIAHSLPYTLQLAGFGIIVGVGIGLPTGVYMAINRNRLPDYVGRVLSLGGLSVPAFYLGILLILLFAVQLKWLPAIGGGDSSDIGDTLGHLILPGLTLGLGMAASTARLTRSTMLNVLPEDFVRTARAKGLRNRSVVLGHALRAALIPIVALTGVTGVGLIGDSVTTELVFSRPGLGSLMVNAVLQRDYTTLQSTMVVYALIVLGINLLTDLAYGIVDPRVRR